MYSICQGVIGINPLVPGLPAGRESLAPCLPSASEVSACYWYGTTDLVWPLVQTIIIKNKIQSFHFNMAMWLMSSAAMALPC